MITYYLKKWWYNNGWTYLFIGCIVIIFFLWIFYANKNQASSTTTFENAMQMIFSPTSTPSPRHPLPSFSPNNRNIIQNSNNDNSSNQGGTSIGEEECRRIMEELTGKPFQKHRPKFLKNPITGQCLELDLYNEELQLAVEYNGKQHYEYNEYMHQGSRDKFRNQQYRDYIKTQLCRENGIYLITVPYNVKRHEIKHYLMKEVRKYLHQ